MRLVATAWNDQRVVYHLSTIHPPDLDGQPATIKRKAAHSATADINIEIKVLSIYTAVKTNLL